MDQADALTYCERSLLRAFSRHTTERLNAYLPLRMALPWLERFLTLNLNKEVRKDSLAIHRAAAVSAGESEAEAVRALLAADREIDRDFLKQVVGMPFDIVIRYQEIEPIRRQRVERLMHTCQRIQASWQTAPNARAAIQAAYPRAELEHAIAEMLRLYARETQALSHSLRLPFLLSPLRDQLARALYEVMTEAAAGLAREAAGVVYRRGKA